MALQTSGAISLLNLQTEFGGANPIGLNEYYRGGAYVPNISQNNNVPTGGSIALSNFYGATAYIPPNIDTSFLTPNPPPGWMRYRVTDGVNTITGVAFGNPTYNFSTQVGRKLVITIHAADDDNSGGQDLVRALIQTGGGSTTIDQNSVLTVGCTASALLQSTITTAGQILHTVFGNPDRGDRIQISIRVDVNSLMMGRYIYLVYNDDPGDDDFFTGVSVRLI
jgi:hypothetical protein